MTLLEARARTGVVALINPVSKLGASATEYAPFLLAGMAVWGFLRESAVAGSRALISNESYIRQSPIPYVSVRPSP